MKQQETLLKCGALANVRLSVEECAKLKERFGELGAQEWIDTFSEQKQAHGYKYKSDYAAILAWSRRNQRKITKRKPVHIDYERLALAIYRDLNRTAQEWESDRLAHRHTMTCQHGLYCSYAEDRRPRVPTLESIRTKLKQKENQ